MCVYLYVYIYIYVYVYVSHACIHRHYTHTHAHALHSNRMKTDMSSSPGAHEALTARHFHPSPLGAIPASCCRPEPRPKARERPVVQEEALLWLYCFVGGRC